MKVVTRFAPSPTGNLHIGGARTALFNYLFAKHFEGSYVLRIEDTDKERSTDAFVKNIFNGLTWLGLLGDEPVVYQSNNIARHKKIANELAISNKAYFCYLSQSEIETIREQNKKQGKPFRSPWRDPSYSGEKHEKPVLRLRMPEKGDTDIKDLIQGNVRVSNRQLDDLVLTRSDGSPTYMLAVVVDDHDMGITHILRGDDHLNNAIRQTKIFQALDWKPPIFGHMPLIHGSDGAKLSKRHGAIGIDVFKEMGFYPQALNNYLARLGWSHGDDEYFSRDQAISWFNGNSIGRSAARFDMQKLITVNAHWLRKENFETIYAQILEFHSLKNNKQISNKFRERLRILLPHLLKRASLISELSSQLNYIIFDGSPLLRSKANEILTEQDCNVLKSFAQIIDTVPNDSSSFKSFIENWLTKNQLKMKDLGIPLRIVLTGSKNAPAIFELIQSLGVDEVKFRINQICI